MKPYDIYLLAENARSAANIYLIGERHGRGEGSVLIIIIIIIYTAAPCNKAHRKGYSSLAVRQKRQRHQACNVQRCQEAARN